MSKKKIILIFLFIFVAVYYLSFSAIGTDRFEVIKNSINPKYKNMIVKYFFPYKKITILEERFNDLLKYNDDQNRLIREHLYNFEYEYKKSGENINIIKKKDLKLSNNLIMEKYELLNGLYHGIHNILNRSAFLDFHQNNLLILTPTGILSYISNVNDDKIYLNQISNNIYDFINSNQFNKDAWFSLKDLSVYNNKIFISYTEEINQDCWNVSVIFGDFNYDEITFKKLFSSEKCISSINNVDKIFNAHQTGGRIVGFDDENILLTTGEFRNRYLAQEKESINGKIIKINFKNKDFKIISMGHRNPQGLLYDKENNIILSTEHGPEGGDEINLIDLDLLSSNNHKILNYGWPISSYGEHYGGKKKFANREKYKKYPLYKSHSKHNFIEPLKFFTPSIGISEITKIDEKKYIASSLKAKSIYLFELNELNEMINLEMINVYERVRDIKFKNKNLYLFLENTGSIGVIRLPQ